MKTIAIMQPYFLPYIGYWQLMEAVDIFVFLDDVNFISRGYINRNNILLNGSSHLFSIPLNQPSQNKLICDTKVHFSSKEKGNFLLTITMAYKKAPHFNDFFPILESIIMYENDDLTQYITHSAQEVANYCQIQTKMLLSSNINHDRSLKAQDKIIAICRQLQGSVYINASGGQTLYSRNDFQRENMELRFIKTNEIEYKQFNKNFIANLSIIDILMFNSRDNITHLLKEYVLI